MNIARILCLISQIKMKHTSDSRMVDSYFLNFIGIFLLWFLIIPKYSDSQEIAFAQYLNVKSLYNPASSGIDDGIKGTSLYFISYPGTPWNYQSIYMGVDIGNVGLPAAGGIGLFYLTGHLHDNFTRTNTVGVNLSGKIPFSKNLGLRIGLKVALLNIDVNLDKFREYFSDVLDPEYGGIYQDTIKIPDPKPVNKADLGIGALFQFSSRTGYFLGGIGASANNLFRPDISNFDEYSIRKNIEWNIYGNFVIDFSKGKTNIHQLWDHGFKMLPGICYYNNGYGILMVGADLTKFNVFLGAWYRRFINKSYSSDALIFNLGYQFYFKNGITIKPYYSFELRFQNVLPAKSGVHEFSLAIQYDKLKLISKK